MMRILVTGGAGFIGSHIVDEYLKRGHRVWVMDNLSSGTRGNLPPQAILKKIDIRDAKRVRTFFKRNKIDIINHHAAQIDVRKSVVFPSLDAESNIMGFLNLLECARDFKIKKFIFASSGGTIYGECVRPATEHFPEVPLSPYGVAKLAAEKYLKAFSDLFGLSYTILRYANVYGPRQDPNGEAGVVAIFSQCLIKKKQAMVYGTGRQTRDYVYVGDVANANAQALRYGTNKVVNISTGKETSVNTLYKLMSNRFGAYRAPVKKPARSGELNRSVLSCKNAKNDLHWTPSISIKAGLEKTLDYFLQVM